MTPRSAIAAIEAALEKATEGEWKVCGGYTPAYSAILSLDGYIVFRMADRTVDVESGNPIKAPTFEAQRGNIESIATLHNSAPALLQTIKALEAALREVQPYFEGEHFYDHPHCALIRAALAVIDKETP